ncbi:glycine cleavage system protein GcvH [Christensenellaceae bacterium OttesenSCG-928-K19]|nr:glycine cleavage system protein GcvH [Christensenellaceae bacterium OttesenSCG-928-K19]
MNIPSDLKYAESHEWVKELGGGKVQVGITDHAQEELGDLVYVELPQVGDVLEHGDNFAVVESVKATSDVIAPVDGTVSAINEEVADSPEIVNSDCYGAWLVELEGLGHLDELMDAEEYEKFLAEQE